MTVKESSAKSLMELYKTGNKFLLIAFFKLSAPLYKLLNVQVMPPFSEMDKQSLKYTYNKATRRLVFAGKKRTFNKIHVDTSLSNTQLCELGGKFCTTKSPGNLSGLGGHRAVFTGIYTLLFTCMRDRSINFAEIGIEANAATKMWRSYFSKASIYGFEYDDKKIRNAEKHELKDTYYHKIDVRSAPGIVNGFRRAGVMFDIIVDDSTHVFEDQIRIIDVCKDYLKEGGVLIIEDIFRTCNVYASRRTPMMGSRQREKYRESNYYKALESIKAYYSDITFIESSHVNNYTEKWKNEKLLMLVRNGKK